MVLKKTNTYEPRTGQSLKTTISAVGKGGLLFTLTVLLAGNGSGGDDAGSGTSRALLPLSTAHSSVCGIVPTPSPRETMRESFRQGAVAPH